jgi:hypothetical protein
MIKETKSELVNGFEVYTTTYKTKECFVFPEVEMSYELSDTGRMTEVCIAPQETGDISGVSRLIMALEAAKADLMESQWTSRRDRMASVPKAPSYPV